MLTSTTDYLTSLKAQVEELSRRNRILEAQLPRKDSIDQEASGSLSERASVQITDVCESTSDALIVDLQVRVRGEYCSMLDLVIRVMEFLKQDRNVSLMSMEAQPVMVDTNSMNRVVLRLKIEVCLYFYSKPTKNINVIYVFVFISYLHDLLSY